MTMMYLCNECGHEFEEGDSGRCPMCKEQSITAQVQNAMCENVVIDLFDHSTMAEELDDC